MTGMLQDLEDAIKDAREAADKLNEHKVLERITGVETKLRDLEDRLWPFLQLLKGRAP